MPAPVVRGYTTVTLVAAELGLALDSQTQAHAYRLIGQAEAAIDVFMEHVYLGGPVTDEVHFGPFPDGLVYVDHPPLDPAVTPVVKGRAGFGATETTLTVATDWEVRDAALGEVQLAAWSSYDRLRLSYTPVNAVPADIQRAATLTVCAHLQSRLRDGGFGLQQVTFPDVTEIYDRQASGLALPQVALDLLDGYRFRQVA